MATIIVDTTDTIPTVASADSIAFVKGGVHVVNGLDLSALAAGVVDIFVGKDWFGNIASPSSSLRAEVDGVFRYQGNGACWFSPDAVADVAALVRNVGRGTLTINGVGTVTAFESGNGQSILGSSIIVPTIRVAGGVMELQGTAGTAPTTITVVGGSFKTARGATTINVIGGVVIIEAVTNAIGTINYYGGQLHLGQSGTITNLNIFSGDARSIKIGRPITITNTEIWGSVPGASAFLDQTHLITFTNAPVWRIDVGNNYLS